uniref:hypothetical protein n=1 Tax=Castellaniella defragrans TaxID=75697 RepID=UPI00333E4FDF
MRGEDAGVALDEAAGADADAAFDAVDWGAFDAGLAVSGADADPAPDDAGCEGDVEDSAECVLRS